MAYKMNGGFLRREGTAGVKLSALLSVSKASVCLLDSEDQELAFVQ